MISKKKALVWAVVLVFITAILTYFASNVFEISIGNKVVISKEDFISAQKFLMLKKNIEAHYVEGTEQNKLIDGALKGMFESLEDPYSVYMTQEEFKDFMEQTSGEFSGIGIIVTLSEDGYVTVVSPIEDTPAFRAGIKTGDKIIKVDDKDVVGMELDKVVHMMKGPKGTKVKVTVMRGKDSQPIAFSLIRDFIKQKAVKSEMLKGNIGYIRISMFDEDTGSEFKKALNALEKDKMQGLIIDLRGNPGGYVEECVKVADELLDDGLIVYTLDKQQKRKDYTSKKGKVSVPYVILVDEGSASASEIVSGAVKDRKAGKLIGTKTFGKGLVQASSQLPDGSGFKLTVEKYYTPNGISINKVGIQPDIEVKPIETRETQNPENVKDVQLERAIEEINKMIK